MLSGFLAMEGHEKLREHIIYSATVAFSLWNMFI